MPDTAPTPDRPAPMDPAYPAAGPLQPARRAVTVDPPAPVGAKPAAQDDHEWDYLVP